MAAKVKLSKALRPGYGCLGRTALDEPVFILRAQDILAQGGGGSMGSPG